VENEEDLRVEEKDRKTAENEHEKRTAPNGMPVYDISEPWAQ